MHNPNTLMWAAPLTVLFVLVGSSLAGPHGGTVAFVMALVLQWAGYACSGPLALKRRGARAVSPTEQPDLHDLVGALAARTGHLAPALYLVESHHPNACAVGRNPTQGAIAVTTGLLKGLSADELRSVLAHEWSHLRHRDLLVTTLGTGIAGAMALGGQMVPWIMTWSGYHTEGFPTVGALVVTGLAPIAALLIAPAISRWLEYHADAGAAGLIAPAQVVQALRKLHLMAGRNGPSLRSLTPHLRFVHPFRGSDWTRFFSTHPPIEERIARLEARASRHAA